MQSICGEKGARYEWKAKMKRKGNTFNIEDTPVTIQTLDLKLYLYTLLVM